MVISTSTLNNVNGLKGLLANYGLDVVTPISVAKGTRYWTKPTDDYHNCWKVLKNTVKAMGSLRELVVHN